MRNNYHLTRDYPAFIPEHQEKDWPKKGPLAEQVAFVPDGSTPEEVFSGEYHRKQLAKAEKKAK